MIGGLVLTLGSPIEAETLQTNVAPFNSLAPLWLSLLFFGPSAMLAHYTETWISHV